MQVDNFEEALCLASVIRTNVALNSLTFSAPYPLVMFFLLIITEVSPIIETDAAKSIIAVHGVCFPLLHQI